MKRKVQLITGGIIIVLIAILSAYYLGFFGKKQVKLTAYSEDKEQRVDEYLEYIHETDNPREREKFQNKLLALYFSGKQNLLHYVFNGGNLGVLEVLLNNQDQDKVEVLFEEQDEKGNFPLYYYKTLCEILHIQEEKGLDVAPMKSIEHLHSYLYDKDIYSGKNFNKEGIIQAIESGNLTTLRECLFSNYGNGDKKEWKNPLAAIASLDSNVPDGREIEKLFSTLKHKRKENAEFWQKVGNCLDYASNIDEMVNYLHKLVVTSREKNSLLYYIVQVGGFRGYLMYKHIQLNHIQKTKSDFSDLLLAANDPHKPIKLTKSKDIYTKKLQQEIKKLQGYVSIDPDIFTNITPTHPYTFASPQFRHDRTSFHACVLMENIKNLVRCCEVMQEKPQHDAYLGYWKNMDYFGLTPVHYLQLVKDPDVKQQLTFLSAGQLPPTSDEKHYLKHYKQKRDELSLGKLQDYFNENFLQMLAGTVANKRSDKKRTILHIAAWLGEVDVIEFLRNHHPNFKELCKKKDRYEKTPLAYAEKWLKKEERERMCNALITEFERDYQVTAAKLQEAINNRNSAQIAKWQNECPTAIAKVWAKYYDKDILKKPIGKLNIHEKTFFYSQQDFDVLERLRYFESPSSNMVTGGKALVRNIKVDGFDTIITTNVRSHISKAAGNATALTSNELKTILGKQKQKQEQEAAIIPDHKSHNQTMVHKLLPSEAVDCTAQQFSDLLDSLTTNPSFKPALYMQDDNENYPLDLVKKALNSVDEKEKNTREVADKLDIIAQYIEDHWDEDKDGYICPTKETARSLYLKNNYRGLQKYLTYTGSYMSLKLFKEMIEDGAYDVIEQVCATNNSYVISACRALMANSSSELNKLLKKGSVQNAIKCRYLLNKDTFIEEVINSTQQNPKQKRHILHTLDKMWKAYPVYWATMVNKHYPDASYFSRGTDNYARPFKNTFYLQYFFVGSEALKKQFGFNDAHLAVIFDLLEVLEAYDASKGIKDNNLAAWLKKTDHMGSTPLEYIIYGTDKDDDKKQKIVQFIDKIRKLNANKIIRSPRVISKLDSIKKHRRPWEYPFNVEFRLQWGVLSPKEMLEELGSGSNRLLHYACLGTDSDIEFLGLLLETGHFTKDEIEQKDIYGCKAIDYVPEDLRGQFKALLEIYKCLADVEKNMENDDPSTELAALIEATKNYKPEYQGQLRHTKTYTLLQKFYKKRCLINLLGGYSHESPWEIYHFPQDNYFTRLCTILLKEEYQDVALKLIDHIDIASLDAQDIEGKTWLIKALQAKRWDIALPLLEKNVNVNLTDIYHNSPRFLTIVGLDKSNNAGDLRQQIKKYIEYQKSLETPTPGTLMERYSMMAVGFLYQKGKQLLYVDDEAKEWFRTTSLYSVYKYIANTENNNSNITSG